MKKRIFSLLLALVMAVSLLPVSAFAADDYELRVLTFEDADYKGGTNFANGNDWSSLIDDPQYGGKLLLRKGKPGVIAMIVVHIRVPARSSCVLYAGRL